MQGFFLKLTCLLIFTEVGTQREKADCSVVSFKSRLGKLPNLMRLPCCPRVPAAVHHAFLTLSVTVKAISSLLFFFLLFLCLEDPRSTGKLDLDM